MKTLRYTLTLPQPPSANRWWRNVNGRMVKAEAARQYQQAVATRLFVAKVRPIRPPAKVALELVWYRSRQSGDLDKRLGVALDAFQGTVYENDAQIIEIHAHRRDDKANPRLEVVVYEVPA